MPLAVDAQGLVKAFGSTRALDGLDLAIPEGELRGVLGPTGSGKTTSVRVLATLLRPDAGTARVLGFDVLRQAAAVRAQMALTGQYASVDEALTGRENLPMVGRLYGLPHRDARGRADELLERFSLDDAADRPVRGYSGACAGASTSPRASSAARPW